MTKPDPRPQAHLPMVRRQSRKDSGDAFMPDPGSDVACMPDELAEALAESFLVSATSGEESSEQALDEVVAEEIGGPFVEDAVLEDIDEIASASGYLEPALGEAPKQPTPPSDSKPRATPSRRRIVAPRGSS